MPSVRLRVCRHDDPEQKSSISLDSRILLSPLYPPVFFIFSQTTPHCVFISCLRYILQCSSSSEYLLLPVYSALSSDSCCTLMMMMIRMFSSWYSHMHFFFIVPVCCHPFRMSGPFSVLPSNSLQHGPHTQVLLHSVSIMTCSLILSAFLVLHLHILSLTTLSIVLSAILSKYCLISGLNRSRQYHHSAPSIKMDSRTMSQTIICIQLVNICL